MRLTLTLASLASALAISACGDLTSPDLNYPKFSDVSHRNDDSSRRGSDDDRRSNDDGSNHDVGDDHGGDRGRGRDDSYGSDDSYGDDNRGRGRGRGRGGRDDDRSSDDNRSSDDSQGLERGGRDARIVVPAAQTVATGSAFSLQIELTADNDDTVEFSATGLPNGLAIDKVSGLISGTVTAAPGEYNVTVATTEVAPPERHRPRSIRFLITVTQ